MSEDARMTLEELEMLAARWGADVDDWPTSARAEAQSALAASTEARETLDMLAAMERELANARFAPPPDDLTARILADAAAAAPKAASASSAAQPSAGGAMGLLDYLIPLWRPAIACAASALVGLSIGYLSPDSVANAAASIALTEDGARFSGVVPGDEAGMEFDLAYAAPELTR